MLFKEVIGLEKIKKELVYGVAKKRIAHAQLFNGPKGSGKLALAIAYARFINCNSPKENDSCQECSSCLQFSKLAHPDLHILYPVIKTANNNTPQSSDSVSRWAESVLKNPYLSLNQWSDVYKEEFLEKLSDKKKEATIYSHQIKEINKKLSLKIFSAKYRVVLIWMPEKMNIQSSNKFLKLLEEPPKKTILLLVSEDKEGLIKTITSRVQSTYVKGYTVEETIGASSNEKTDDFLNFCRLSSGNMGRVLSYNQEDNKEDKTDSFIELMRTSFKNNFSKMSEWSEYASQKTRQQQIEFLQYSIDLIRECLIYNYSSNSLSKTTTAEKEFLKKFSQFINEENSVLIFELFESSIQNIARNASSKIILFNLSLKLANLLKLKSTFVQDTN